MWISSRSHWIGHVVSLILLLSKLNKLSVDRSMRCICLLSLWNGRSKGMPMLMSVADLKTCFHLCLVWGFSSTISMTVWVHPQSFLVAQRLHFTIVNGSGYDKGDHSNPTAQAGCILKLAFVPNVRIPRNDYNSGIDYPTLVISAS